MTTLVVGINGGFGALFADLLADCGAEVVGVDLAPMPRDRVRCARYLAADAASPSSELLATVRASGSVLICLPEEAALPALAQLAPELAPGALLVDTLSVVSPVAALVAGGRDDVEILCLNPLFAPDLGLAGRTVAAVPLRPGPSSDRLLGSLRGAGARVAVMTADEHDRSAAAAQAATHAALLAYGLCLGRLGPHASFSTPPQHALLALAARVVTHDPEVYRRIQADNPYAAEARAALAAALAEVGDAAAQGSDFVELFARVRASLAPSVDALADEARRFLE